jgi:hypothetical protein
MLSSQCCRFGLTRAHLDLAQRFGSISRPKPKFPVQGFQIPLRFLMNQAGLIQSWTINHSHSILWVGVIDGSPLVMADLDIGSRPEHDASCVSDLFGISQLQGTLLCLPYRLPKTDIHPSYPSCEFFSLLWTIFALFILSVSKSSCMSCPSTHFHSP